MEAATSPSREENGASTAPSSAVNVEQVRKLLKSAGRCHRCISEQIVAFGDDPSATQFPVKDARRCDFPLSPVPMGAAASSRPGTASALKQQQQTRATSAGSANSGGGNTGSAVLESEGRERSFLSGDVKLSAWRNQLQLHVVHLLQKLRTHPDQLREFLLVNYEDESEDSAQRKLSVSLGESEEDSGDEVDSGIAAAGSQTRRETVAERLVRRERVLKKRMGKNYAKLRLVFSQLHRVAFVMGETLYQQVHSMVRRSVAQGVINRQANLVRLESIYKLELRRQITTEKLLETVKMKDAERKKKKRRQKRDEQHVRAQTLRRKTRMLAVQGGHKAGSELAGTGREDANANSSQAQMHHSSLWDQHTEMEPIKSAHFFKMHALERVLALEWRQHHGITSHSFNMSAIDLLHRLVSEQTEELIHEKLTAFLYSKNRDTFPVWKDPPESSFSREETLRYLKRLLPVLMTMPLFLGLTIDQLVEFVRVTKWRTCRQGHEVLVQGAIMDELVIVMDGKLDFQPQVSKKESKPDPKSSSVESEVVIGDQSSSVPATGVSKHVSTQNKIVPTYFGELGMLSKTEEWKSTLFAKSSVVKVLVLSRAAFDTVLQKLFGGSRSRQLLLVAQQRPSSSPAASARGYSSSMSAISPTWPYTATGAAAREKNVAALRQMQEKYLQQRQGERDQTTQLEQQQEPGSDASNTASRDVSSPETSGKEESQDEKKQGVKPDSKQSAHRLEQYYPGSTIQHYPSFETPARGDSSMSGIAHTFHLKWAQPIAFQMESLDDSIFNEWAPSFPDTSAMVDFLSSSSLSSMCLLFEKKNVLLKENLRSVCFHHQFLSGAYKSPYNDHSRNAAGIGSIDTASDRAGDKSPHPTGTHHLSHGATFTGDSHGVNSGTQQQQQEPENSAENGSMTLAQFSDARKKSSNAGSSRRHLNGSSSMQNLLNSPLSSSATVLNLGNVPFSRSSFVAESSFYAGQRGGKSKHLSTNNEADDEDDEEEDDSELDLSEIAAFQAQDGVQRKKSTSRSGGTHSQSDDPNADDDGDAENKTTRARKMALDSLMYSMSANSPRKSKLIDQDTAKEIIVKKYLQASNAQDNSHLPPKSPRAERENGTSTLLSFSSVAAQTTTNGINMGIHNSHAPLPLRVDLQRRMEVVLTSLKMKPKAKLDLVLKYTHADHYDRFQMAVVFWEQALHYVTKREAALASLWKFELVASDPRRHFRSLSTHRLSEQKERDALFYQLNFASDVCREALAELEKQCGDKVYFEDRLYADKMKKDYTELLFDVEQERLRMIYSGVRPSVSLSSTTDTKSEQSVGVVGSESGPRTPARPLLSFTSDNDRPTQPVAAVGETPSSKWWKRFNSVMIPTPPPSHPGWNSSNNNNNEEDDQALQPQLLNLNGSTTSSGVRHRLANPQESIYVCITKKREQEEKEAALEKQRQLELQPNQDEKEHRRRSSHGANHRMTMQVRLQRETELNELTQRLEAEKQQQQQNDAKSSKSSGSATPRPRNAKGDGGTAEEVRQAAETTSEKESAPEVSDLALLQRALHHFIHRPKE